MTPAIWSTRSARSRSESDVGARLVVRKATPTPDLPSPLHALQILSASSGIGSCGAFAGSQGARIQISHSSSVVGITGIALAFDEAVGRDQAAFFRLEPAAPVRRRGVADAGNRRSAPGAAVAACASASPQVAHGQLTMIPLVCCPACSPAANSAAPPCSAPLQFWDRRARAGRGG